MRRRWVVGAAIVGGVVLLTGSPAASHPLGNFTTNTYAGLRVGPERLTVDYVVDLAEIPALQARQRIEDGSEAAWASRQCDRLAGGLRADVDGVRLPLRAGSATVTFPPGVAGLPTLRLECRMMSGPADLSGSLSFHDGNYRGRVGWREITAVGDRTTLTASDVPRRSASARLRSYPSDRLQSPLDQRTAALSVRPGGPSAAHPATRVVSPGGPADRLADLVAVEHLTVPFALAALALAIGFGALHSLAPGHGKTVIAAYLLGRDGGARRQAALLGLGVALSHTVGVLVLGLVVSTTTSIAPERAYPLLGTLSGLLFAGTGALLLRRAVRNRRHAHAHAHGHHHHHHDHDRAGWRNAVVPGLAGGLVPSPSALLVFLGGVAIGRAWFGVLLVVAYGIGIAVTLVAAGWFLQRVRERHLWLTSPRLANALPFVTSVLIVAGGLHLAARSAT